MVLDEKRALEQIKRIKEVDKAMEGARIRVFTGIEGRASWPDGTLDLDDQVLAEMEVVIASVHTRFEQSREEMTARVLRAIENPYVRILGHPTGRLLLRREPFCSGHARSGCCAALLRWVLRWNIMRHRNGWI